MVRRPRTKRSKRAKSEVSVPPCLLTLPPELRQPIIAKLGFSDALNLRLACRTLNTEVLSFYPTFQLTIIGDRLSWEQLDFVKLIANLTDITFKRVAKPIRTTSTSYILSETLHPNSEYPTWICTRKKPYPGPDQFRSVGGIQIRSLSAPKKTIQTFPNQKQKLVYDCTLLKNYLLSVTTDDIFDHVKISSNQCVRT